jgi:hypothetical protein
VIAVAVDAARRQRVSTRHRAPVQRLRVLFGFFAVAGAAVHPLQRHFVRQVFAFQVGVAVRAPERAVNGSFELLGFHVERDRAPSALGGERLVAVAGQAGFVGVFRRPRRHAGQQKDRGEEQPREPSPRPPAALSGYHHQHLPVLLVSAHNPHVRDAGHAGVANAKVSDWTTSGL